MIIGFDFDKVFINYPPLIPDRLVDILYKGRFFKKPKKNQLSYKFPGMLEKQIRIFSHNHYFRTPIKANISALRKISNKKNIDTYLVSSRYGFLRKQTTDILKRYGLEEYFKNVYFNFEDKQPHLFKEELINKLKIEKYIDDDLDLAIFLAKRIPKIDVYWLKGKNKLDRNIPKNLVPIKDVNEFIEKYL